MSRPANILIALVTLGISHLMARESFSLLFFFSEALGFSFAISFGNLFNDILDVRSDLKNHPERPLPAGKISLRVAKISALIALLGTLLSPLLPLIFQNASWNRHLIFFIFLSLLLFLYDKTLKKIPFIKNLTVSFLCATPIICVMILPESKISKLIPLLFFSFLLTLSREIQKDLEDAPGDLLANISTLPLLAGEKLAMHAAALPMLLCFFLLPIPVLIGIYPKFFFISAIPLGITFLDSILSMQKKKYARAQRRTKLAMVIGLLFLPFC